MCAASRNTTDHEISYQARHQGPANDSRDPELSRLSSRQTIALPILAIAPNMTEAAREAAISRSTLYRWLKDDCFRKELQRLTAETADLTRQELQSLTSQSSQVLSDLMQDPDPTVRLRAARAVAALGVQTAEVHTRRQGTQPKRQRTAA